MVEIVLFGRAVRIQTVEGRSGFVVDAPDGSCTVYLPADGLGNDQFLREVRYKLWARSLPDPAIAAAAFLREPGPAEWLVDPAALPAPGWSDQERLRPFSASLDGLQLEEDAAEAAGPGLDDRAGTRAPGRRQPWQDAGTAGRVLPGPWSRRLCQRR